MSDLIVDTKTYNLSTRVLGIWKSIIIWGIGILID